MESISAVIITFDEAKHIERCIKSVLPVADEVLICDTNSTDETVKIATELGAKVIVNPFIGFGATKNKANQNAQHNWILSIDADEVLSEELIKELHQLKNNLDNNVVYAFKRLNNYCGKWIRYGGWNPDIKPRLFNKEHAQWNLAEVHESLIYPNKTSTQLLKGELYHYSYLSIDQHLQKIEKYSTRGAHELIKRNKKTTFIKRYLSPLFRFVRDYFFKLGFLDGKYGFIIAKLTAKEVYLKYKKLNQLHQSK
ncbi:MAG: glycosyltransferase family 2 protein [Bacteroidota bacterium]|jgi:glycosyltransferase involved in cell wall biosynthesis